MTRPLAAALSAALASSAAAAPPPRPAPPSSAPAQAPGRPPLAQSLTGAAKADYEMGKALFADGDHSGAIVKFRSAHDLSGDPRLLWNIAACEKNLRHYARMLVVLERYRAEADAMLTDAERETAAVLAGAVRELVSAVRITVDQPGAAIFVDDERVGTSPMQEPVIVDMGQRRIRVAKPGFKDAVRTRDLAGASEVTVAVRLEREVHEGRLQIEAGEGDVITVDGAPVGQGRWAGVLPSGPHAVRVTAPGKLAYQAEVTVQDGKSRRITVTLDPAPGGGTPAWLWIGAGGLALAGAAVGGYFLFRPEDPAAKPGAMGTVTLPLRPSGLRLEVGR